MQHGNNNGKMFIVTHIIVASLVGVIAAGAVTHYRRRRGNLKSSKGRTEDSNIVPHLNRTESGRFGNIERFSHYVARQIGFEDPNECPQLCKLAHDYLKKAKGSEDNIFHFFANIYDEVDQAELMCSKLVEELDKCILSYFAFHWVQAPQIVTQVMSIESEKKTKLKDFVLAATRKQRFDRVSKDLKMTRMFSTLVEELKAIGHDKINESDPTDIMVPAALSNRSPVLLLMGGGMGAGKSTVIKDLCKETFWAGAINNAVVVEADAFKESDVIYKTLNSMGHHDDMLQTSEFVHQSSTDAASSLLVTALNEGRDVIMDGTLSWEPFVEQTIAMVRDVHKQRYRMSVGYKVTDNGTVIEKYWEPVEEDECQELENGHVTSRKPYRIELVGVVCDAYLAVVRGIRRAIITGRAVRVNSQLRSHKKFASAFPKYCHLVDNARLFCTNAMEGPPKLIAWKDGDNKLLIDPEDFKCLTNVGNLNADANSIYELYGEGPGSSRNPIHEPGSVWNNVVCSSSRASLQLELKDSIQKIENPLITA